MLFADKTKHVNFFSWQQIVTWRREIFTFCLFSVAEPVTNCKQEIKHFFWCLKNVMFIFQEMLEFEPI